MGTPSKSISVVIPLYNRESLIQETLASIECQLLPPFEVIVVDDYSTDRSVEAVVDYQKTSKLNIVILSNGFRKGMCGALNWGIKQSSGEMIAMQDSDDLWTPDHLQMLWDALEEYPAADIAFSAIEVFGPAADAPQKNADFISSVRTCLETAFEMDLQGRWVSNKHLLFALLMFGFPFRCQASLIRKDFFFDHDLFFDTDITYTLDSQFMTIASYFSPFVYVDKLGLRLRRHSENDGDAVYGEKIWRSYEVRVEKLKKFFQDHPISLREKMALHNRLWSLQAYVAFKKASGGGFNAKVKSSFELLWTVPTWNSVKSAAKLMLNRNAA